MFEEPTDKEKLEALIAYLRTLHLTPIIKAHLKIHFGIEIK